MKFILCLLLSLALQGCLPAVKKGKTSEEKAYVEKILAFTLEPEVSKSEAADAWGRAQSFIGSHSTMKIQTATDFVIQTYNPVDGEWTSDCGYSVIKTPIKDKVKFQVGCNCGSGLNFMQAKYDQELNSHILSNYIVTGDLPFPALIKN